MRRAWNRILSDEQRATILARYGAGEGYHALAAEYGVSYHTIWYVVKRGGGTTHPTAASGKQSWRLSREQKAEITRRYEAGEDSVKLGAEFGLSAVGIRNVIHRRGRVRPVDEAKRIIPVKQRAFSDLTEHSAYWAGFLMADGSILANDYITLRLSERDECQMDAFKAFVNSTHRTYREAAGKPGRYGGFGTVKVTFSSKRIVADLARFGIVRDKTHTARAAGGLEHDRHFWRGVIDGDGTLGRGRVYPFLPYLSLVGSRPLLEQFTVWMATACPGSALGVYPNGNIFRTGTHGRFALAAIQALYADASIALPRKRETAMSVLASEEKAEADRVRHRSRRSALAA